ncbi:MAG: acyltransferase, partial [Cytophagaceae bacterium]
MKRHFIALDGLRGVAAILVLIGHASVLFRTGYTVERMLLAVQFFFMLSGFVIASAYDGRIGKGTTFFDFMTRRVIRLYPLILIGTSLGVIALAASGEALTTYKSAARVALAGANIPCIVCSGGEPFYFAINPPGWSLFFEMLAYATFAAGMWKLRLPTLMMVTGLLLLGSIYAAIQFT